MDARARAAYLELLKQTLTRARDVEEGRSEGRRRRRAGALLELLGARGASRRGRSPVAAGRGAR